MATTVQQAAVNALVAYLREELPDVTVNNEWPASEAALPELAVSVLMAGKRVDDHSAAEVVAVEGDGDERVYTWRVKYATQSLQLDVWANYPGPRDALLAQLDDILNRGEFYTLAEDAVEVGAADPTRDGLLLALRPSDGHAGFVDFTFDGPSISDSADRAIRHEYRATIVGEAEMVVTTKTTHPVLRVAGLRLRLRAGEVPEAVPVETHDVALGDEE